MTPCRCDSANGSTSMANRLLAQIMAMGCRVTSPKHHHRDLPVRVGHRVDVCTDLMAIQ